MAALNSNIGTRATITLTTTTYEATLEIKGLRWSGSERAVIDSSHMGTADMASATTVIGNRTYIAGELIAPGQLTIDTWLNGNVSPPYYDATTTANMGAVLTIPSGTMAGATWSFTCFLVSFDAEIPEEDMMTSTLVFQPTGPITIATGT